MKKVIKMCVNKMCKIVQDNDMNLCLLIWKNKPRQLNAMEVNENNKQKLNN